MTNKIKISHEDWVKEALSRNENPLQVKFKCPVCGYIATGQEYLDNGATEGAIGFVCIGRFKHSGMISDAFGGRKVKHGPCNYTGGGLFRLNPITVIFQDGTEKDFFDFAENPLANNPKYNSEIKSSPDNHH